MTEVKITKHGKAVIKKIVAEMTDVFISCVDHLFDCINTIL